MKTKVKNNDQTTKASKVVPEDKGNFSSGFIVGILAGAAGFFLTKTNEGKEIRKKTSKEWGSIKKRLEDEGVITGKEVSLVDIISNARSKIFKVLGEEVPKKKKRSAKKGRRSKSKSKAGDEAAKTSVQEAARKKKMFKGI